MRFDPKAEVEFRARLAEQYLQEARRRLAQGDWRGCVQSSQLAAENAAKALISFYRVPSWSHDPSEELYGLIDELPEEARRDAARIAELAHRLAPEHGRATYGEPSRGMTPWELYKEQDARRALDSAEEAVERLRRILDATKFGR